MKTLRNYILAFCAVAGGWLAVSLLCWPILLALQALTTTVFIPHPAAATSETGFVSTARLLDFPTSFVGARFRCRSPNMPLGFIAIAWWFAAWLIVPAAYRRYRTKPRGRASRTVVARSPPGAGHDRRAAPRRDTIPAALRDRHTRSPLCPTPVRLARARISARLAEGDPRGRSRHQPDHHMGLHFDGDNRFTTTAPTSTRSSTCCRTHPQRPTSRSSGTS